MAKPLMPKATAVWLVENTALTFGQIAEFCELHELEVQAIADEEVAPGMVGMDPVAAGQLTKEEIARCEADSSASLQMHQPDIPMPQVRSKGPRYTPVTKRAEKPDGVAWLLKTHPELSDAAIARLIGTTKPTINSVRDRTHWNTPNIKPRSPVLLGLCKQADLDAEIAKARRRMTVQEREAVEAAETAARAQAAYDYAASSGDADDDMPPPYDPFGKAGGDD
ncbi:MAG: DUF1013 domain-containing protein [Azospirillaceae bacterium]